MAYTTVAGPMTITVVGLGQLEVEGDHTWNLGSPIREEKLGPNGEFHGFSEKPQLGMVEGTIVMTEIFNKNMKSFLEATNVTVTMVLPNGGILTMLHGFQSGTGESSTENGTLKYGFKGDVKLT
jgi:hypothetical protein